MATVKKPNINNYVDKGYQSQYKGQISAGLDKVTNRKEFTYDPLKDASYQALSKIYTKRGEQARQNVMGDAAAMTGGYASSYATSAAAQAQSDYNQQLAAQIPALQEAAYNRYTNEFNMNLSSLNALQQADESEYGRHRDNVADNQWKYDKQYDDYRNNVADNQWKTEFDRNKFESDRAYNRDKFVTDRAYNREKFESDRAYNRDKFESNRNYNYQKHRDKVNDRQWNKEYSLKKKSLGGSGSRRSGGGSSSGYNYVGGSSARSRSGGKNPYTKAAKRAVKSSNGMLHAAQKTADIVKKNNKKRRENAIKKARKNKPNTGFWDF